MSGHKRILLTGFGPFPGIPENATSTLVPLIAARASEKQPDFEISHDVLPVAWRDGPDKSRMLIEKWNPDLVLHFGVSEAASGFVIETRAQNACQPLADANGELPPLELLDLESGTALSSTIPFAAIVARLRKVGLPAELSDDAGGYLCNAVWFQSLRCARADLRAGFVHVPCSLGTDTGPLTMADAVRGGVEIISTCIEQAKICGVGLRSA